MKKKSSKTTLILTAGFYSGFLLSGLVYVARYGDTIKPSFPSGTFWDVVTAIVAWVFVGVFPIRLGYDWGKSEGDWKE